ncbi:hypothetical protein [Xanthomonas theicola]|uniref:Uncharacterized protein n=1 Tax=Xanthomonas theicola TaxID=56464 RepID=A0A2S6YZ02_9XANT|nr:hypothetical protein [Xanthomonas theicola]PPT73369.1 hypothetical protein XthCFBP4691_20280 [Xanthomonas theicola]QNH23973.1 hypothetical protein G4Q83_03265 [Xanthomonas theicola]
MNPIILSALLAASAAISQEVMTPNYTARHAETGRMASAQSTAPASSISAPAPIQSSALPTSKALVEQFDQLVEAAAQVKATSYLAVDEHYLHVSGCDYHAQHPRGVARISDGAYNSVSVLLKCSGFIMQVEITDFTQPTSPMMKSTLPGGRSVAIAGARMVSAFAHLITHITHPA